MKEDDLMKENDPMKEDDPNGKGKEKQDEGVDPSKPQQETRCH